MSERVSDQASVRVKERRVFQFQFSVADENR